MAKKKKKACDAYVSIWVECELQRHYIYYNYKASKKREHNINILSL